MKWTYKCTLVSYLVLALLLFITFACQSKVIAENYQLNDDLTLTVIASIGMGYLFLRLMIATFGVIWNYRRRGIFYADNRDLSTFIKWYSYLDFLLIFGTVIAQVLVDIQFFTNPGLVFLMAIIWIILEGTCAFIYALTSDKTIAPIFYGVIYEENIRY